MVVDVPVLGPNGKLSPSERTCQKRLNLCLYCESGHQATACPSKRGKVLDKGKATINVITSTKPPLEKAIPWV